MSLEKLEAAKKKYQPMTTETETCKKCGPLEAEIRRLKLDLDNWQRIGLTWGDIHKGLVEEISHKGYKK